ncbi:KTSC domain-containing protein [Microbacterium sp. CFBP9034]|uniref:KTSC domain-containing protein n=1 Tax=Microbacterium sp. CFBP9034 TaxID=3096540 RepID=UPI002A6AB180|nr:KTSC domain-containing protein [Microbacterium sp. CFBP9034]MDY0909742.1 KTSC domain-containing protein [Microbacterium sp. CFBP9034]
MKRVRVDSRAVSSVGYDSDMAVLELVFTSGEVYRYYAVPPSVHRGLLEAESIGRYFGEHIRGIYPERHER